MHLRRIFLFVVTVLLVGLATDAFAAVFRDTEGTDYAAAFAYLSERGVVHGYGDGIGKPGAPLKRADALKVILEAEGSFTARLRWFQANMPPLPLFRDSDQSAWYGPYVEVAFEEGIISGYPDGTLRPGQELRVEEAVALLMRAFDEEGDPKSAKLSDYVENRQGEWFTPFVNSAIERNLVMHKGRLRLGVAITRGQFFDMVYRLHALREKGTAAFEGPEPSVAMPRVSVPVRPIAVRPQSTNMPLAPTGVSRSENSVKTQSSGRLNVGADIILARIDHPYASEKYFAVTIPSLGITDLSIIHPADALSKDGVLAPLKDGVGHLFSYPGGGGKIMIYGHSSGYPWDVSEFTKIFRRVNELNPGDMIYITYSGKLYVYEVTHEQTIAAKDTAPFSDDGAGEELILYTCWPTDSISQRYLVHAVPVDVIAAK